jgi:hypothetical protein
VRRLIRARCGDVQTNAAAVMLATIIVGRT